MKEDSILLGPCQQKALKAICDFAFNAFQGYAPGHGKEEEQELQESFQWLVTEYIELIFASSTTISELDKWDRKELYEILERSSKTTKEQ